MASTPAVALADHEHGRLVEAPDPVVTQPPAATEEDFDEEEDEFIDGLTGNPKEDLRAHLDEIYAPGSFCAFKKLDQIVDPGVKLLGSESEDDQLISIPLSTQDAREIIEAAHQAPFGKGEETIIDTSVRNTWELNPDKFVLSDHWQAYVNTIMKSACDDLGVRGTEKVEIKAELYKIACAELSIIESLPGLVSAITDGLSNAALESLGNLVSQVEWEELSPTLENFVLSHKTISGRYQAISSFAKMDAVELQHKTEGLTATQTWARAGLSKVFEDVELQSNEDVDVAVKFATTDASGVLLRDRILPMIQRNSDSAKTTKFGLNLLCNFFEYSKAKHLPRAELTDQYNQILETILPLFAFRRLHSGESPLDGVITATVINQCYALNLYENANRVLVKVTNEVATMYKTDMPDTVVIMLRGLIMRLRQDATGIDMDVCKRLFQESLTHFIMRYVEVEPAHENWAQSPVRCTCNDCISLNRFLKSPLERVGRFPVGKPRRHHLHVQLTTYTTCTHTTERYGNPQTLVVTKKGQSLEEKRTHWKKRADWAVAAIKKMDTDSKFMQLLGDKYGAVKGLTAVRTLSAPRPSTSVTAPRPTTDSSECKDKVRLAKVILHPLYMADYRPKPSDMPLVKLQFDQLEALGTLSPAIIRETGILDTLHLVSVSAPSADVGQRIKGRAVQLRERYTAILDAETQARASGSGGPGNHVRSEGGGRPAQTAGQKRKAVVVDLTMED